MDRGGSREGIPSLEWPMEMSELEGGGPGLSARAGGGGGGGAK